MIFFNCKKKSDNIILNENIKLKLIEYINENPIKKDFPYKVSKSIYQIYIDRINLDTIIAFKLTPHLDLFSIIEYQTKTDTSTVFSQVRNTRFFYMEKYPIVLLDAKDYSKFILNHNKAKKEVPDEFKFKNYKYIIHLRSDTKFYKLTKDKLKEIDISNYVDTIVKNDNKTFIK